MGVQGNNEDLEKQSDADLLHRYREGDDNALAVLLGRHADALYRFCCSLLPTREDAEDICQEAMTRAIMRVDSLQSSSAFRSWLFSIAKNLSIDSFRTRQRVTPLGEDELHAAPAEHTTPSEAIEAMEEHQTVALALGRLRARHQRVLMLREVDGLSYADIAAELEVSESAVETLLFRARRRLREEFSKREGPMAIGTALGTFRDLLPRLMNPVSSYPPLAAKLAFTAALVAGSAAVLPAALPHTPRSALNQAGSSVLTTAAHQRPRNLDRAAGVSTTAPSRINRRSSVVRFGASGSTTTDRSYSDLAVRVGSGRPTSQVVLGFFPVTPIGPQHETAGERGVTPKLASPASHSSRFGTAVVGMSSTASEKSDSARPGVAHGRGGQGLAVTPASAVRTTAHGRSLPVTTISRPTARHRVAATHSGQGAMEGAGTHTRRDQQAPARPGAAATFRLTMSAPPMPSKRSSGANPHQTSAGGKSGAAAAVPHGAEAPVHPVARQPILVPTPAATSTATATGAQPLVGHGVSPPDPNVGGGSDQGRHLVTPSPVPPPVSPTATPVTTAVSPTSSVVVGGNPHRKPHP